MANYLAHITEINGKKIEQTMAEHSLQVARYAANKLKGMGLYHTAYLAGLLHDMGKCTEKYQNYLKRASAGEDVVRGSVNHTFSGCIYLFQKYHIGKPMGMDTITCELLGYAIGAHHGQFDCVAPDHTSGFEHRLKKEKAEIEYDEAVAGFHAECATAEEVDRLFQLAQSEVAALFQAFKNQFRNKISDISFFMGLVARMLLSAVIDGDRRDTAEFMQGVIFDFHDGSKEFWAEQISYFEQKIKGYQADTPINQARADFSSQCQSFAKQQGGGIYRLTLPTGAGKTLSALRYAMTHAEAYGKKRILFVIPLLSILEQNSAVIRDYIQDKNSLVEHHSNVIKPMDSPEELNDYELCTETWEAPMIITTLVQFLNTLFSDKTSTVRRMSALAESVIVIDEVQSLPKKTTYMFTMALNFLAYGCGATIVLSSATTPCFDTTDRPLRYSEPADIVPYQSKSFSIFERTKIIDKTTPYGMSLDELVDFSTGVSEQVSSLLIICNTKESALKIYGEFKQRGGEQKLFHLSASMCMAHRTDTLERIHRALKRNEKMVCVSTQLVEAGVDFSFESVIRVAAGMDNVAQAAGRCNRSNDFGKICTVYIVNLNQELEKLGMLQEIGAAQQCSKTLLASFAQNPSEYSNDLLSEKSIAEYYQLLFQHNDIKGEFVYPQQIDHSTIYLFDLLADNLNFTERPKFKGKYFLNQSFRTAGELFEVFDENTTEVIVPYHAEADKVIADLFSQKAFYDIGFRKDCIEKAKPYTIQIFEYQKRKLHEYGMLSEKEEGRITVLNKQCYHPDTGLIIENFIF